MSRVFLCHRDGIGPRKIVRVEDFLVHLNDTRPVGDRAVYVSFVWRYAIKYGHHGVRFAKATVENNDRYSSMVIAGRRPLKDIILTIAHEWRHIQQHIGLTPVDHDANTFEEIEADADSVMREWSSEWLGVDSDVAPS